VIGVGSSASGAAPQPDLDLEAALKAIAHPGRRRVLELVADNECASGELAEACNWTKPATSQHLNVLRDAGLIESRTVGNRRLYRARAENLARLRASLDEFWGDRLRALSQALDGERSP